MSLKASIALIALMAFMALMALVALLALIPIIMDVKALAQFWHRHSQYQPD